jgi:hypothetical protein
MIALVLALSMPSMAGDLDGTWAMENLLVSASHVDIIGKVKSRSYTWIKLKMEHDGETATVTHSVCGSRVRGSLFKSRIPPAYVGAVPTRTYTAMISEDGTHYTSDLGVFNMGVDPACAVLPTEAGHPCLRDVDHDGNPGATIQVKLAFFQWVDVYVAQRNHLVLDGALAEDGWFRGGIIPKMTAVQVVGASKRMFARSPAPPETLVDESSFRMVRVDADASCADVIARLMESK